MTSEEENYPVEVGFKYLDMYSVIYSMRQDLERQRKPVGTRENPARSCRDLHIGYPNFDNDWYWIDPNLGMIDDAIYVYCNMSSGGSTCIHPDTHTSSMPNIPWRKEGNVDWYSKLRSGFKVGNLVLLYFTLLTHMTFKI